MNTVMLSFVMLNKVISIIYCLLFESFSSYAAVLYINLESWPVVGFYPHNSYVGAEADDWPTLRFNKNGRT